MPARTKATTKAKKETKPVVRLKRGRPGIEITAEVTSRLCERLIGGESITYICSDPAMPSVERVYNKMANDEDFRKTIARARELQQDAEVERTVHMADLATPEDWQVVKLRIWARQWRAAKLAPKKYGERVMQEITGKDGGPVETKDVSDLDRAKALAALVARVKAEKTA